MSDFPLPGSEQARVKAYRDSRDPGQIYDSVTSSPRFPILKEIFTKWLQLASEIPMADENVPMTPDLSRKEQELTVVDQQLRSLIGEISEREGVTVDYVARVLEDVLSRERKSK